jgi:hypothetical protein
VVSTFGDPPHHLSKRASFGGPHWEMRDCQLHDLDQLVVGEAQVRDLHVGAARVGRDPQGAEDGAVTDPGDGPGGAYGARLCLNWASLAFAFGAAGSPNPLMLAAVPTLRKNPDPVPFQAHCPATHPPLGMAFAWNPAWPTTLARSAEVRTAHASKAPAWPLAAGVGLAPGVEVSTGVGDAPAGGWLASGDADGRSVETLATGVWLAVTLTFEHAVSPTADSTTTSSACAHRDAARARPGDTPDSSRMIELLPCAVIGPPSWSTEGRV